MDKTAFIRQFIYEAGSSIISVSFIKQDGSLRQLSFNPRDTKEIKGTGKPSQLPSSVAATSELLVTKGKAHGVPSIASA